MFRSYSWFETIGTALIHRQMYITYTGTLIYMYIINMEVLIFII